MFNTQSSSPVELRKVWPISQCWRRVSPHFRLVTPSTVVSSSLSFPTILLCWTSTTRFLGVSLASSPYWHEILSGGIRNRFGAASQAAIQRANVHLHNVANYTMFQTQVTSAHAVKSVTVHFRLILVAVEPGRMAAVHCVTTSLQVLGPIQRQSQCVTGSNSSRLKRPETKAKDSSSSRTEVKNG